MSCLIEKYFRYWKRSVTADFDFDFDFTYLLLKIKLMHIICIQTYFIYIYIYILVLTDLLLCVVCINQCFFFWFIIYRF